MGEYNVYFIDTPGFDDTNLSDLEILKTISNFFSISDTRMGRTKKLNLEMLKALCGEDAFSNTAILTTMWETDESSTEFDKQVAREEQLKEEYLTDILGAGGLLKRIKSQDSTTIDAAAAKEIFQELFDSWKDDAITLRIQDELVNDDVRLNETSAGKLLSSHLDVMHQQYETEITQLRGSLREMNAGSPKPLVPKDEGSAALLEQQAIFQNNLDQFRADQEAMKVSLFQVYAEEKERFTTQISALEACLREELAARKNEQALREQVLSEVRASVLQGSDPLFAIRQQNEEATEPQEQEKRQELGAKYVEKLLQHGTWHEEGYEAELEQTRKDVEDIVEDLEDTLKTTTKARESWVDLLVKGTVYVAGYFCEMQ